MLVAISERYRKGCIRVCVCVYNPYVLTQVLLVATTGTTISFYIYM